MNSNPAAPENNLHHTVAYRSKQEWYEDMFGKGPGDPDVHGHYPGEPEQATCYMCNPGSYPLLPTEQIWDEVNG